MRAAPLFARGTTGLRLSPPRTQAQLSSMLADLISASPARSPALP